MVAGTPLSGMRLSTVTLLVLWFLTLAGALLCYVLAELYQRFVPDFPLLFVVVLGSQLQGLCSVAAFFLGKEIFGSVFKAYQPFQGGTKFIILQFLGILNVSTSLIATLVYLILFDVQHIYTGAFLALECSGFIGNFMILLSIRYYSPQSEENTNESERMEWSFRILQKHPNSQTVVVLALLLEQCIVAELPRHAVQLQYHCAVLCTIIHAVNGFIIHFIIGCRYTPGYTPAIFYLPQPADTFFFWLKWLCYWISFIFCCCSVLSSLYTTSSAMLYAATVYSLLTTVMVLLLVRTTQFKASRKSAPKVSILLGLSSFLVVVVTLLVGAFTLFVSFSLDRSITTHRTGIDSWFGKGLEESYYRRSTFIVLCVFHGFSLLAGPIAFVIGKMVHGEDFNCFLNTKPSFVFLHAAAGGSYTMSIFSFLMLLTTHKVHFSLIIIVTSALCPLFLNHSLRVFEPIRRSQPSSAPRSPVHRHSKSFTIEEPVETAKTFSHLLNGDLVVGFICELTSFVIRLVANLSGTSAWGTISVPVVPMMVFANLCFLLAVPLVHISAREHGVKIFHPFSGSGTFVALQVIGWMIYASLLIFSGISFFLTFMGHNKSLDSRNYFSDADVWLSGWKSMLLGFLEFIPMCLITISISIESQQTHSLATQRNFASEGLKRLVSLTRAAMIGKSEEEINETQFLLDTLLQPALEYYRIQAEAPEDGGSTESEDSLGSDRLMSPFTVGQSSTNPGVRKRHQGAFAMVVLLSCASVSFFVLSAFFASSPTFATALQVLGFLLCTVSCAGSHAGYGTLLNGPTGEFAVFIPFKGGKMFVYWQVSGWICYSCVFLLSVVTAVDPSQISVAVMSLASVLSVASQALILHSIPIFLPQKDHDISFLEENGEGMVALLACTGAYGFQCLYDELCKYFGNPADTRGNFWLVMTVVSMSITVPCVFIAIGRTTSSWSQLAHRKKAENKEPSVLASAIVHGLQITVLPLGCLVPVSVAYVIYALSQSYTTKITWLMECAVYATFGTIVVVISLSLLQFVLNVGMPSIVVHLRVCFVTWCTYGLAALEGLLMVLSLIFWPRCTTFILNFFVVFMTVLGTYKWSVTVMKMVFYGTLCHATVTFFHNSSNLYHEESNVYVSMWLIASGLIPCYVFDVVVVTLCLLYMSRYHGRPSITGALRSEKFISFARRYIFSNCVEYFHMEVHVDDEEVNFRDPDNQYLFSFHPHGVFPGTALFAPLTEQWVEKMGTNPVHHITTHAASVIFNVPIVRDFNLSLGALTVSRRGIDASLDKGNSVIIVTGGQAEMLHTKISDTVMTLVTHHKGFFRVALSKKVPLVPLLCFGEQNLLGLLQFPRIQRATLPLLGFPFPIVPHGRFGFPIPRATKLVLVVGRKIDIPENPDPNNEEMVEQLRKAYFNEVKELFYRHREAAGYPTMELKLVEKTKKDRKASDKKAIGKKD